VNSRWQVDKEALLSIGLYIPPFWVICRCF